MEKRRVFIIETDSYPLNEIDKFLIERAMYNLGLDALIHHGMIPSFLIGRGNPIGAITIIKYLSDGRLLHTEVEEEVDRKNQETWEIIRDIMMIGIPAIMMVIDDSAVNAFPFKVFIPSPIRDDSKDICFKDMVDDFKKISFFKSRFDCSSYFGNKDAFVEAWEKTGKILLND